MNFWSILLSGGVFGFVIGALVIGASAYDQGFRAGTSWGLSLGRPRDLAAEAAAFSKAEELADA